MVNDNSAAFTDVLIGDNRCPIQPPRTSNCPARCQGFQVAQGWDAVTGLGTPVYQEMANYIMFLGGKFTPDAGNAVIGKLRYGNDASSRYGHSIMMTLITVGAVSAYLLCLA